ncbi:ribonuclease III [Candidatus Saccharibacteria bacterium]|nr:ribonuclease III [Candidatus Saccharibacteria bacterium]
MNKELLDSYISFAKTKLGLEFNDINLLISALTHRSYINEHRSSPIAHNERLEFLGDAVLELVTSDFLYCNYDQPEGVMTSWRAALVNTEANARAGKELGYEPLIRLSRGERNGSERAHHSIIADCYEAIIGAIYLDHGYAEAEKFIKKHSLERIDEIIEEKTWRDAKSFLQQIVQKTKSGVPKYSLIKEDGPDHDKTFTVAVIIDGHICATGSGHSKQDAQVKAAEGAIRKYRKTHPELFLAK